MSAKKNIQGLIIGANGLIGREIGRLLSKKGILWVGTYSKRPLNGLVPLNILNSQDIKEVFSRFSPDAVFHCANLAGGVDFCEKNPEAAGDFHLNATKNVGSYCKDIDALLVFISTDYVFDGTDAPYREDAVTNPLNLYGRLKLQAECWIQENLKRYIIIRTTNVYGWDPETVTPNYVMAAYRACRDKKIFNAPSFLWGNPTYAGDLAEAVLELYLENAAGVFHVIGNSFINRYEWALKAREILILDGLSVNEIKKPSSEMVRRPFKSWLNTEKFVKSHKTILHNVTDGLRLMKSCIPES